MVLRSQDPKDVRGAHKERQKVLHKKDFRKSKEQRRGPTLRPWRAPGPDCLSERAVLAAADVPALHSMSRKLARTVCGRYVVDMSKATVAREDSEPAERKENADSENLSRVESTWTRERAEEALETEESAEGWLRDSASRMSDAEALELAIALSLSLEESSEKGDVALTDSGTDVDAYTDFDDDLISLGTLEEEDEDAEMEADWVDLYEDVSPGAGPNRSDCERPTYAQMTKFEVT